MKHCNKHRHDYLYACMQCTLDASAARVLATKAARPKRKSDIARYERAILDAVGDARRTELLREVKAGEASIYSESPIYQSEVLRLRYSQGGLHDRLKQAAQRINAKEWKGHCEWQRRAFIGNATCQEEC